MLLALGALLPALLAASEDVVETPIYHQAYYQGEYDLFGYDPGFVPNVVSFDADNRPFMRAGPVVQRFDPETPGWETSDLAAAIHRAYPEWDGDGIEDLSDNQLDHRLAHDDEGDIYTVIPSRHWPGIHAALLLRSRDGGIEWSVHELPARFRWPVLEFRDGHNDVVGPPLILLAEGGAEAGAFALLKPTKRFDGSLVLPPPVIIDEAAFYQGYGQGNLAVTRGERSYVVWASPGSPEDDGTPAYIAVYDHRSGTVSERVLLGRGGHGEPDVHNLPAITIDSRGVLHVLLGAHHDWFKYTRSLEPYRIDAGWSEPVTIPATDPDCGSRCHYYTYVSMVCDPDDALHVVARWAGNDRRVDVYSFSLAYLRKPPGGDWEPRRILVFPFRNFYSHWYHRLSQDRRGRLFVYYKYYANQLFAEELAAYNERWPQDEIEAGRIEPEGCVSTSRYSDPANYCTYHGVRAHDPALLVSDDGGDSWRLATAADFAEE